MYRIIPITVTIISVTGNAIQSPILPPANNIINAIGIIRANPLKIDMICAGTGYSVEVKNIEIIIESSYSDYRRLLSLFWRKVKQRKENVQ